MRRSFLMFVGLKTFIMGMLALAKDAGRAKATGAAVQAVRIRRLVQASALTVAAISD